MTKREQVIEVMARAICQSNGLNPDSDWRGLGAAFGAVSIAAEEAKTWRRFIAAATAALTALEQSGYIDPAIWEQESHEDNPNPDYGNTKVTE